MTLETTAVDAAETVGKDLLSAFRNAAAGIHAQFANTLFQAGHSVSEANTASQLINVAMGASATAGKPVSTNTAPNYADFALTGYFRSMEQLAIQFAAAHLPDKLKPVVTEMSADIQNALGAGQPVTKAEVAEEATKIAAEVGEAVDPALSPVIEVAAGVAEQIEGDALAPKLETTAATVTAEPETAPAQAEVAQVVPEAEKPVDVAEAVDPVPSKASLLGDGP